MGRFVLSQLRHRRSRTAALGAGILVAAVSFTLLTSAADTSALRVRGTVSHNFRSAYDILVRPQGSFTPIECRQGLVQQNYLSGIFGGITFRQYREIKAIPGVEIAAPIANIGYIFPFDFVPITITRFLDEDPEQLYRLRLDWVADRGSSVYPDASQYVYFTKESSFRRVGNGVIDEVLPNGDRLNGTPCSAFVGSKPSGSLSPFNRFAQMNMTCFSSRTPDLQGGVTDYGPLPAGTVGTVSTAFFPIEIAAIDPVAEAELVGLDSAVVSGRMLAGNEAPHVERVGPGPTYRFVPFLASTRTYVDETLRVRVERLEVPDRPSSIRAMSSPDSFSFMSGLRGHGVGGLSVPISSIYRAFVEGLATSAIRRHEAPQAFWTASSVSYANEGVDRLRALPARNGPGVFQSSYYGPGWAPNENRDVQFRRLSDHDAAGNVFTGSQFNLPALEVVGRFDPERLPGFSPLSRVPLETYYPPQVRPADPRSRRALGGNPLLPTQNLGGYVAQPPLMLITLRGLRAFVSPSAYRDANARAPISVIRIRVAGVRGPDAVSRERIRSVAQAIHDRTGLAVDITAGSSPHPMLIDLPPGRFGRPALTVREGWVKKGVAVAFLDAIDRKSLLLFGLILVICAFFLANGTLASVRSRRAEIGTPLCLGWSERAIFRAVLGEVATVGLLAGALGSALAVLLVPALSLQMPLTRTLLALPVALVLALLSGLFPAWRAAHAVPMDAVRPVISERGLRRHLRRVPGVAMANLARVPSRTALGAAGLAIGVAALTILLALNEAFHGVLVGTLLGNALSVRVRGVDLLSVVFTIALGGLSVLDVLFLNVRERAPELVTLRTVGWRESDLRALIVAEGVGMGALGCVAGALFGAIGSSFVRGVPIATIAFSASVSAAAGVGVAAVASLAPLGLIERLTPPTVLAEE